MNNGVLLLDAELKVIFWNNWLYIQTGIAPEDASERLLSDIYPDVNLKKLRRKMQQCKALGSNAYYNGASDKYLIPIKNKSLTGHYYDMMQQDAAISYLADLDYFLINVYDCTAYLEMEHKLLVANDKVSRLATINEQYSKSKSEFLAHTSHELRTPLNSILGFMELMKTTRLTREQRDYLNVMQDSSHSMLDIVNSVMSISEVEKGILEFKPTDCNIMDTVKSSAELFYAKALEKSISLICFIDPALPVKVFADGSKIRQVLLNFISNAIKFTPVGGRIWVKADLVGMNQGVANIRLTVQDSGIGMSEDFIKKIFLPYEREKKDEYFEGSGVGLYICSKFAELMHTSIEVKSEPGEGSEFSMVLTANVLHESSFSDEVNTDDIRIGLVMHAKGNILSETIKYYIESMQIDYKLFDSAEDVVKDAETGEPLPEVILLADCDDAQISDEDIDALPVKSVICMYDKFCDTNRHSDMHEKIITYRGILDPKSFYLVIQDAFKSCDVHMEESQKRVLVMEDNYNNQMLMKVIFDKLGAVVDVVSNGEAGLIYFKQHKYDLVLIDINMPIKNGIDTIRDIREYVAKYPHDTPPIYALTAHALKEKQEEYVSYGFDGFLVKPISVNTLKDLLAGNTGGQDAGLVRQQDFDNPIDFIRASMHESMDVGWEDVSRLLGMFFASVFKDIDELKKFIEAGDTNMVKGKAHFLKGQMLSFHLFDISGEMADIEHLDFPSGCKKALVITDEIEEQVKRLFIEYKEYLKEHA